MEQLRWFVDGLVDLFNRYIQVCQRIAAAVASEFQLDMAPQIADLLGSVLGVLVLVAFFRGVFRWDRHGHQPQAIHLYTAQTPNQVVSHDIADLFRIIVLGVVVGVGLAVAVSMLIAPPPVPLSSVTPLP
jgi:hypothetical protein